MKKVGEKFGRLKNLPYLCTTFRSKNAVCEKESSKEIRIKFFEDIEQLRKFFLSRKREISNNTFEIRAKIYNNLFFYNGEFDPGSG